MNQLIFTPENHQYTVGGKRLPSVTQILKRLKPPGFFTEESKERGQYVHACTAEWDQGSLDFDALEDKYKYYVQAWIDLLKKQDWEDLFPIIELPMFSKMGVAGTPDRIHKEEKIIIDIKTGVEFEIHDTLQLIGYEILSQENIEKGKYTLYNAYLRGDGKYSLKRRSLKLERRSDKADFLSFLRVHHLTNK